MYSTKKRVTYNQFLFLLFSTKFYAVFANDRNIVDLLLVYKMQYILILYNFSGCIKLNVVNFKTLTMLLVIIVK